MSNLHEKAMLAGLTISVWTARKTDKRATLEVISSHGAREGSGNFNKSLVAKDALAAVSAISSEARAAHYAVTLPWTNAGERILPAALYLGYAEKMRDLRSKFDGAVSDFLNGYFDFVEAARLSLGSLFDADDYPSQSAIARKFSFDVAISPIPAGADFRVSLGADEEAEIRAAIEARTAAAVKAATADVWERMREVVGRMVEKLGEYRPSQGKGRPAEGVFRDSLVDNVRDLVAVLPSLNFAGDAALAAIADDMAAKLCNYSADDLRSDDFARLSVAKDAQSILDAMSGFCGEVEVMAAE